MFNTLLIQPIYNGFIYLIGVMPSGDVGFAIIAMTIIVRAVFYPAFASSIRTQMGMQAIQGELDEINKKYKDNSEERAKRTMELFSSNNVRPFSGFLALFVQIPVFIALYYAFFSEGLPKIAAEELYSFVHIPLAVNVQFLGFVDLLAPHNIVLAALVGVLQYLVTRFSLSRVKPKNNGSEPSSKESAQRLQQHMMLYFLPLFIAFISYSLPAAVGIYFCTGNVISLGQEWIIRQQMRASKK